ncbi:hypothetical protein [Youngiibacter multivorans]|uniref:Uncharacterized protein n=1 Tax=Youngiibacter multivorans TaxID=937251 RepID=A0ABS4G8S9_9CLOT|nr:hypothetical protein [Youngiibacter multivorans]MBP1920961.1 hypothetical protein [Youngiibacter multivorans]
MKTASERAREQVEKQLQQIKIVTHDTKEGQIFHAAYEIMREKDNGSLWLAMIMYQLGRKNP